VKVGEAHLRNDEELKLKHARAEQKERENRAAYEERRDEAISASTSFAPSPNASLRVLTFS